MTESGLGRRDPTLVGGGALSEFTLCTLAEVAGEDDSAQLHAKVADEQQLLDASRPPLGALDVNVGDGEVGARRVRCPAELASHNHALAHEEYLSEHGTWIGVHEKSLLRRTAQWVLGDDVEEFHRQGATMPDPSCTQITCHGTSRCEASMLRFRSSCRSRIPVEDLELVSQSPTAIIRTKSRST